MSGLSVGVGLFVVGLSVFGIAPVTIVEGPVTGVDGIITYKVTSPFQRKTNAIEVLLPDKLNNTKQYPVLYILPVNDGIDGPWGSGVREAKRHNIHNTYGVICVAPAYDETPWFGDHPTDPTLRQESYLLKAVIPFIEERYPALKCKEGRLLLGFSKSGFGAISMFLRNLDILGKAVAWDAPLTGETIPKEEAEMLYIFATEENYRKYYIPGLIQSHADQLRNGPPRVVLVNNGRSPSSITEVHEKLTILGVPHLYAADDKRDHNWTSGWLPVAVKLLFQEDPDRPTRAGE